MSTIKHPVGPQPSSVYWRRRFVVGLGLLAVIIIIVLIVARPGSGDPSGATDSAGTSSTAPASTDAAEPPVPQACDPASVLVEAVTDKVSYNEGEQPQLSLTITNQSGAACSMNAGSDAQEFRIMSGAEQYWSSKDCQSDPVATEALLEPGAPVSTPPIAWDRTRSSPEACGETERDPVPAGGASYHLVVSVDGIESESRQFLLY